jgi:hypothetical protein
MQHAWGKLAYAYRIFCRKTGSEGSTWRPKAWTEVNMKIHCELDKRM